VSLPLARYTPSRLYLSLTLFAAGGAVFSAWMGLRWAPCWVAAALFALCAVVLAVVTFRPVIEIHENHLAIGRMAIPWRDVERIDQTGWNVPLAVNLTLRGDHRILLLYPGDPDSSSSLLRHLLRFSREALLDGVPYRVYWGEPGVAAGKDTSGRDSTGRDNDPSLEAPARYPLLRAEDEEEVERMFQRLKSVGNLESKNSDEK
jgi:hypothetical protein